MFPSDSFRGRKCHKSLKHTGNRYLDWFREAEADLQHARHSLASGDHERSCFAAHPAAEESIKAVSYSVIIKQSIVRLSSKLSGIMQHSCANYIPRSAKHLVWFVGSGIACTGQLC